MSITSALHNAASGLTVQARLADTISNNVSNALTEGYAKRTTEVSSLTAGGYRSGGARVVGTTRAENAYLTATRRTADASVGATQVRSDAYDRMMTAFGEPGDDNAVSTLATGLETALMSATAAPQSTAKLADAVNAAAALAASLNHVSEENASVRTEADAEIDRQVAKVNTALNAIDDINRKISIMQTQGLDTTSLEDERGRQIDSISSVVPVKTVKRDNGAIAIYSQNGGVLLDDRVFELKFTPAANVTADMAIGAGLSGLSQDQGSMAGPTAVAAGTGSGLFDGGSLGALFEVRDTIVPEFDAEIDRYATDLIDRFQTLTSAAGLDGSGAGLFVDAGTGPGIAGRIAINAAVDPTAGGEVWRLRDGLAATAVGSEGNGALLQSFADAMSTERAPAGFLSQSASNDSATIASEIATFFAGKSTRSDEDLAYLSARQSSLSGEEADVVGVDSDSELQSLMLVEQAYAANAKVLSVIDDLMKLLLE